MVMYSQETSEIAKPSELLNSVKAYMNVLQSVENYVNIDITRVFNNVLLQQTQQVRYLYKRARGDGNRLWLST